MKKKSFLAVALALTLVFTACGSANTENAVHNTEIGTEHVHETETELVAMNTESVDVETESVDSTEVETESEVTEKVEKETEKSTESKSDSKKDDSKTDTSKTDETGKDESSKNESSSNSGSSTGNGNSNSSNTGSNNSGSSDNGSNSNTGSNSGNNSNTGNNDSGSSNGGTTTTPEPETPVACSHSNTTYYGGGTTHDIICFDCLLNKNEVIVLSTESCDYSSGVCACGVRCPHSSASWDSSSSQSGHCNMICNLCGTVFNNVHDISWKGDGHSCSRCGTFWPCDHANCETIRASWDTGHAWYCNACGAHLYDEGHTFVNGSCSACGWAEPVGETPTDTTSTVNEEGLPEDIVTDVTP